MARPRYIEVRLERLPSQNQPWQPARTTAAERRALAIADRLGEDGWRRAVWALWGNRRVPVRLRVEGGQGAPEDLGTYPGAPRPAGAVFVVHTWFESTALPGSYTERVDVGATGALLACTHQDEAIARFRALAERRDGQGVRLTSRLYRRTPGVAGAQALQLLAERGPAPVATGRIQFRRATDGIQVLRGGVTLAYIRRQPPQADNYRPEEPWMLLHVRGRVDRFPRCQDARDEARKL